MRDVLGTLAPGTDPHGGPPLDGAQHDHGHRPSSEHEPPRGRQPDETVLVLTLWAFAGQGYTPARACSPQHSPPTDAHAREENPHAPTPADRPEAAAALAISRSKLDQLLTTGGILSVRIAHARRIRIEDVDTYVQRLSGRAS